ncbi:type IV pilin protein [Dyella sp. BiH032]|uniref:type IV pilin protein n=1 Tax=Dyella sp. BiH032 TaxID=3075430 RepID=UPI0028937DE9|nr:type IV pilin protein [Dyella sp. BiH032]WNL47434.1 type IV pilin protein [Dyella sp. BiH032]
MVTPALPFSTAPDAHARAGRARARGFTLVELMIVVAVIAILAAVAIPNYYRYMLRANRAAAEDVMLDMASAQERYMIDSRVYTTDPSQLGYGTLPDSVSSNYTFTIALVAGPPPGYTITAAPKSGSLQSRDTDCGTLKLDSSGNKTASGSSTTCWKK